MDILYMHHATLATRSSLPENSFCLLEWAASGERFLVGQPVERMCVLWWRGWIDLSIYLSLQPGSSSVVRCWKTKPNQIQEWWWLPPGRHCPLHSVFIIDQYCESDGIRLVILINMSTVAATHALESCLDRSKFSSFDWNLSYPISTQPVWIGWR